MNARIKELAEQAGFVMWAGEGWNPGDTIDWSCRYDDEFKKFTELLVKECAQACIDKGKTYEVKLAGEYQSATFADAINKHFGVI